MYTSLVLSVLIIINIYAVLSFRMRDTISLLSPAQWPEGSRTDLLQVIEKQVKKNFYEMFPNDEMDESEFADMIYVPDEIRSEGYKCEIHHVTTADGYILELHRIPQARNRSSILRKRRPILLNHCLMCSSAAFIAPGPGCALGYLLVERGYDVWLMNARGTSYSRNHTHMTSSNKKYWKFGLDEIGLMDIPACIDYILYTTKWPQVDYLGFSMGTTTLFALLSHSPEYNSKIRKAALIAPVPSGYNTKGNFVRLTKLYKTVYGMNRGLNLTEEVPWPSAHLNSFLVRFCSPKYGYFDICEGFFHLLEGSSLKGVSENRKAEFFRSIPDRGSLGQFNHFKQIYTFGAFRQYSYGRRKNIEKYGRAIPPKYDYTKITTPIALFWSEGDKFVSPLDIHAFATTLKSLQLSYRVPYKNFVHLSFLWDDHVYSKIHWRVMKYLTSKQ